MITVSVVPGAYLAAVALSVDRMLEQYRTMIVELDEMVEAGAEVTLSRIYHCVSPEEQLFSTLRAYLDDSAQLEVMLSFILSASQFRQIRQVPLSSA